MRPPPEVEQPTYEIVGAVECYDQRDHATARAILIPGTPEYEEYYSRHPEHKGRDDENRRLSDIAHKKNREKDPINTQFGSSAFYGRHVLGARSVVEGLNMSMAVPGGIEGKANVNPDEMSRKIKAYGRYLGAAKVRIARLKPEWVYTNFAHPYSFEPYGDSVELDYPYIICMAITQDLAMVKCGIGVAKATEVSWKYSLASLISVVMAQFIRFTGWRARALPPGNTPYLVVPSFVDAGIGEQGRCSYVVTKEFGNNFRPAAVATDMPLALDKPVDFGLQDFCEKCLICAEMCPSGAITKGGREVIRGVRRWPHDGDKCRGYWDRIGTVCGICQAVCPWNHTSNPVHNSVRELSQSFPFLRNFFLQGEKLVYGKFKLAPPPDWMRTKGTQDIIE